MISEQALSALESAAGVRSGRLSAVEGVEQSLDRITRRDRDLNAFTLVLGESALAVARRVDAEVRDGRDPGPLAGVPFAAKNLFDVQGVVTLAGSVIDAEGPPAPADATLVARLRASGAILMGCLNMDEYAYGFTTENVHYGATRNPHNPGRIAGGSSGGSAAAVAASLVPISLGSDTNGSIRAPAALCGVFGLKPTYGRLSRHGARAFVHSLDHTGAFARTPSDLALVYDVLQGHDPHDPVCVNRAAEPVSPLLNQGAADLRVGVLSGWFERHASPESLASLAKVAGALDANGGVVLEGAEAARAAAFCLTAAEGGSLHLDNLRRRPDDFDPATRDRLIAGSLLPARIVVQAQRFRRSFLGSALALFERYDLLLAPTTPFPATPIGQATVRFGDEERSVRANLGLYTQPLSFIGLPVLSVPVLGAPMSGAGDLPTGVQLIAPPWREDILFRAAAQLEREGVIGSQPCSEITHSCG